MFSTTVLSNYLILTYILRKLRFDTYNLINWINHINMNILSYLKILVIIYKSLFYNSNLLST